MTRHEGGPNEATAVDPDAAAGAALGPSGSNANASSSPAVTGRTVRQGALGLALTVSLAHGVNDAYAAFLPPLLPRIMDNMGLSIALAATLAMVLSLAASLLQPAMGWLADEFGRKPLVIAGPVLSGVFLSLIGAAPTFTVLVVFLILGGIGSAAFHPPGASMAVRVSEGKGTGVRYSIFSFGGATGYAVGPLIAVGVVGAFGLEGLWVAMIPGILLALVLVIVLPRDRGSTHADPPPTPAMVLRHLRGPLGLVFGISALQAFAQRTFLTLEPIIMAEAGASEAAGAVALSFYLAGQVVGTVSGGFLTDRYDRRHVLTSLALVAFPAHLAALSLPAGSPAALVAALLAGSSAMAMLPPVIVVAQEAMPAGAAIGSGIVMGLAWATGSIGVLGAGILGDFVGPQAAALASVPAFLVGALLARHPALKKHARGAEA